MASPEKPIPPDVELNLTRYELRRGGRVRRVAFHDLGKELSPFPYMRVVTQDRHGRFLIEHLQRAGMEVERGVELLDFEQAPDGVRARPRHADGSEESCESAYRLLRRGSLEGARRPGRRLPRRDLRAVLVREFSRLDLSWARQGWPETRSTRCGRTATSPSPTPDEFPTRSRAGSRRSWRGRPRRPSSRPRSWPPSAKNSYAAVPYHCR